MCGRYALATPVHELQRRFGFYYGGSGVPSQNMWIDVDDIVVEW